MQESTSPWVDQAYSQLPTGTGPLTGLTFAVKDIFDLKQHQNALGVPDYLKVASTPTTNALAVAQLLAAGAGLNGITITDELMFSVIGSNSFYGAPANGNYPDRYSGGSSCGSASAVSTGAVDFAVGSDTGGSVRIPSAFSGLYGIRPSHNERLLTGVHPMAETFDTVGVMARNAHTLARVGHALYLEGDVPLGSRVYVASELFDLLAPTVKQGLLAKCADAITGEWTSLKFTADFPIESLRHSYRVIQGYQVWQNYKDWITREQPHFGEDVSARLVLAAKEDQTSKRYLDAVDVFDRWRGFIRNRLAGAVLILPTTPMAAPLRDRSATQLAEVRKRAIQFTALNSLSGLPQVNIPIEIDGLGYGLSITGGFNTDQALLAFVQQHFSR